MKNLLAGKKIVEKRLVWYILPVALILIACIAFGVYAGINKDFNDGINLGIDFTGGTMVTIELGKSAVDDFDKNVDIIEEVLKKHGASIGYTQTTGSGDSASVVVRYGMVDKDSAKNNEINSEIEVGLKEAFADKGDDIVRIKTIGATASKDLVATAVGSVALSTILILIYIIFRFKNAYTGIAAIIALLHDVVVVIAMTIIFNIQINSSFIAALITIIAYSINNTIVIFDRVRENYKTALEANKPIRHNEQVNMSIAMTFSRSVNTTITTLAAIVILAIIGVPSIKEFALPVIFGLLAGTFSSVCLAPSLYCSMRNTADKNKIKNANKPKKTAKATK